MSLNMFHVSFVAFLVFAASLSSKSFWTPFLETVANLTIALCFQTKQPAFVLVLAIICRYDVIIMEYQELSVDMTSAASYTKGV